MHKIQEGVLRVTREGYAKVCFMSMYRSPLSKTKWKSEALTVTIITYLTGLARGVVGYQYTRYLAPKIPIYLKIVKCVILNT